MSATRQQQNPWLTDHVVFFAYRWLTWAIVAALSLWQGLPGASELLLAITAAVNLLAMLMSQAYVRAARRTPLLMALDLIYTIVVLVAGEGWSAPYFALHATSSLMLPGLIFGRQGGFIAGWAFVALDQASHWAVNLPPSRLIEQGELTGWPLLATMMVVPPVCGWGLATLVELARRMLNQRAERQTNQRRQTTRPDVTRGAGGGGLARLPMFSRESEDRRTSLAREFPLAMPTTAVRPQEQSAEDLRRLLFAPFPVGDMDLPAVLELLVTRFGDHTGAVSRVALLGRVRATHYAPRGVLVRLAQEALLNVQQHAHAATLTLTLRYDATSVALLIQDDGVGLLDGTYERPGLHALRAMQYRLNELGGRLDVFETEGGGVTVRAMVPLE